VVGALAVARGKQPDPTGPLGAGTNAGKGASKETTS
jgi:hypothetical protein